MTTPRRLLPKDILRLYERRRARLGSVSADDVTTAQMQLGLGDHPWPRKQADKLVEALEGIARARRPRYRAGFATVGAFIELDADDQFVDSFHEVATYIRSDDGKPLGEGVADGIVLLVDPDGDRDNLDEAVDIVRRLVSWSRDRDQVTYEAMWAPVVGRSGVARKLGIARSTLYVTLAQADPEKNPTG